ncbi:hypothetical protein K435DRAFT_963025 [Dendrothele bispora CBS 962.96]|uniref:Mid2 domain-containing protein n=1 Tax=Dendrothele bispora (strain CBS 962.96) TaxID=1314807 RepID=A0A4S8MJ06_DENBC|nr:hypothetical protein K435DRAFT_963025 [Dendrothele bispora CBS 962.96]
MLLKLISILSFSHLVLSALQDRVIDDESGDSSTGFVPIYNLVEAQWNQGNRCQTCTLRPSPLDVEQGTWHDTSGSGSRSIQFRFTGVSITVYGIIATRQTGLPSNTNWVYILDGETESYTTELPLSEVPLDNFIYNVSLLSLSNLSNTPHTLVLEANMPLRSRHSILFDYAKYQFDDGLDSSLVPITVGSSTGLSTSASSTSTQSPTTSTSPPSISSSGDSTISTSDTSQTQPTSSPSSSSSFTSSNSSETGTSVMPSVTSQANVNVKKNHLAVILGSTFGGLAFLPLSLVLFVYIRRHRREAFLHRSQFRVDPFDSTPSHAAAAPLPSVPSAPLIPYLNQLPQTTAMGDGMLPLAGVPSSENEPGDGTAPLIPNRKERSEINQLRAAIADLHRMIRDMRYHGGNGWSLSRDRKARAAAS